MRQGPAEAFAGGELPGAAAGRRILPQSHEPVDRFGPSAQAIRQGDGVRLGGGRAGEQFGPADDPFDEHAPFDVAEPASDRFVAGDSPDDRVACRGHRRFPPRRRRRVVRPPDPTDPPLPSPVLPSCRDGV